MLFSMQAKYPFSEAGIEPLGSSWFGVYGIFNDRNCIYIGGSKDIKASLLEHIRRTSEQAPQIWHLNPTYCLVALNPAVGLDEAVAATIRIYGPILQY
jgi:hypothetical protein